jgi:hypothetical protein
MAVLPTPASPSSTGLFLVRRERIWITRSISLSRPMTGSSLPSRASSVRSRPKCVGAEFAQHACGHALALADQCQQQVFRTDVIVVVEAGLVDRQLEYLLGPGREGHLADADRPHGRRHRVLDGLLDPVELEIQAPQHVGGHAFALADDAEQEMFGPDVVMLEPARFVPGQEQDLAHSLGKTVVHAARLRSPLPDTVRGGVRTPRGRMLLQNILDLPGGRYTGLG